MLSTPAVMEHVAFDGQPSMLELEKDVTQDPELTYSASVTDRGSELSVLITSSRRSEAALNPLMYNGRAELVTSSKIR